MSRKSGAQAGEGKLESRFAALTSGLLARKGQAAPSNSPIIDAAEETEAFTLSDALIPRKNAPKDNKVKAPAMSPLTAPSRAAPPPAVRASQPPPPPPPPKAVAKPAAPPPLPAPKAAPKPAPPPPPQPITIINERSFEAGYPDNPSVEEIEAIEAEADEVVSYLESMGGDVAGGRPDSFFVDEPPTARDPLDDLDDVFDDLPAASSAPAAGAAPAAAAADPRAVVSASLSVREFMRLSLGAAELRLAPDQLIAEAIEEYLDARGVDSLGGEEFLKKLAAASGAGSS
jgi:hypothetical protein